MDRSIRYVREHKVAPLLNDMLTHLLLSQAGDPISALIAFLEKKASKLAEGGVATTTSGRMELDAVEASGAAAAPPCQTEAVEGDGVADISMLVGLDEIVAEILRGEHTAQVKLERLATTHPRTALLAHPLLERFHKNSQAIAALSQQLAEAHSSRRLVSTVGSSPSLPIPASADDTVESIRSEAVQLEKRLTAWLANDSGNGLGESTSNTQRSSIISRAIRQQETLLQLLSQL